MARAKKALPPLKTIQIVPYGMRLHLFVDPGRFAQCVNVCRKNRSPLTRKWCAEQSGLCVLDRADSPSDIWMLVNHAGGLETLVHELYHAVERVREHIEIPNGFADNEPAAHLMSYLFEECRNALNEWAEAHP